MKAISANPVILLSGLSFPGEHESKITREKWT